MSGLDGQKRDADPKLSIQQLAVSGWAGHEAVVARSLHQTLATCRPAFT